ncbi:peptidoglycan-binding protein, partial [Piscibacillus halophilus]|uniref:peptidoglycan-binding protein n=1 Tax=Piscibacillus halophilus TaxID=571933 RepID=UPI001589190A
SEEAKVLKEKLVFLDFADWDNPNTFYASQTEAAVKQLQSKYGLKAHGIADEVTLAKVEELMSMDPQKGLYRQDVIELKEKLVELSFENWSNPNTYFGPQTETAVKNFQAYYGLEVTGIAGEETLNKLDEILTSPLQNGKRSEAAKVMKEKLVILGFADWDNPTTLYASQTEAAVMDFQAYYGLKVHGIGDEVTLEKIEEIISSPLQKGNYSEEAKKMKEKLVTLGFADWDNPTTLYGSETEHAVKWFQEHFDLVANGIGDEVTLEKIEEIISSPLQKGNYSEEAKKMKEKLVTLGYADWKTPNTYFGSQTEAAVKAFQSDQQLPVSGIADYKTLQVIDALYDNFEDGYLEYNYSFDYLISQQMNRSPQTDLYRNDDGYVHGDYINILSETILITGDGVNIRSGPGFSYSVIATGNRGTTFEYTDEVQGDSHAGSRIWYKGKLNGKTAYVHSSLADITMQGEVTATNLNVRETPNGHSYGMISKGTKVSIIDESGSWYKISYNKTWRNAKESDVRDQANPDIEENDINQHLLLTERAGATSSELNQYLSGKGTLDGEGSAFIEAAIKHDINEAYLISHAVHETGHGTSPLAKGIWVDSNGNPVSNQSNPPSGATKVYNMFGIAAFDGQEYVSGSKYAYQQGWTSPKKAIIGGAEWIANKYIYGQYNQNTVYKMRWNPENPGVHQYATDIGWALKQTSTINYIYNFINDPNSTKYSIVEFK